MCMVYQDLKKEFFQDLYSSVYIISKKKRPVYMHYLCCYMVVFCGLPGPQDKDDSARRIWTWILDIIFSHMGNERACALHPQE